MKIGTIIITACLVFGASTLSYAMDSSTDTKKNTRLDTKKLLEKTKNNPEQEREETAVKASPVPRAPTYNTEESKLEFIDKIFTLVKDPKKRICPICNKDFGVTSKLKLHVQAHANYEPHKCPNCQRKFTQIYNLKTHVKNHHTPFTCEKCKQVFVGILTLNKHVKVGHSPCYTCSICQEKFLKKIDLKKHKEIHSYNIIKSYKD